MSIGAASSRHHPLFPDTPRTQAERQPLIALANFRSCLAAIGHVQHVDAGHHLEQLAGHMRRGPIAGRRHGELARIGLGVGDQRGDRRGPETDGLTSRTLGTRTMPATGAMSRMKLKLSLS